MKKYALLMLLCVAAATMAVIWGLRDPAPGNGGEGAKIALVLTQDTGTRIMKLKSGAQDAAADQGAELSVFVARDALPPQVIGDGYLGVILTADTNIPLDTAAGVLGDVRLALIGGEGATLSVITDPFEEGRAAAEALAVPAGGRVALLVDESAMERRAGAQEALTDMGCEAVILALGDGVWAQIAALSPDAVVALSMEATEAATKAKDAGLLEGALPLSGFAEGEAAAGLLQEGLVNALTVPVPYALGYQAVTAVLEGKSGRVLGRTITGETLFDSENVSIVFPLLQ